MFKIPSNKERKTSLKKMNLFNIIQISNHKTDFFNFLNPKPVEKITMDELGITFRVPISVFIQEKLSFSLDIKKTLILTPICLSTSILVHEIKTL